eukprot:tig00000367_g24482.t1
MGTKLKVTNLWNQRSVVVKVNDRGPFGSAARIIDLSGAAARAIGLTTGSVPVSITVAAPAPAKSGSPARPASAGAQSASSKAAPGASASKGAPAAPAAPAAGKHVVRAGDSLWTIAAQHKTTVAQLQKLNPGVTTALTIGQSVAVGPAAPAAAPPAATPAAARKPSAAPAPARPATAPPRPATAPPRPAAAPAASGAHKYTIRPGDCLWTIAGRHKTTVAELRKANPGLTNDLTVGNAINVK